ncbi:hypothetical protein [Streptomyces virginiae]|uniref:hypothetical protein n=1 Tax=Streptomyces virginiae TaxID=1961 RepID=UPI0032C20F8B
MAVEERGQVLAGGEAAERVPRTGQDHVERVHLLDPDVGEDAALIAPVDLVLAAGSDFEVAVQPRQVLIEAEFGAATRPSLGNIHFHPLVVALEAVLVDQPSWITAALRPMSARSQASTTGISGAILRG